MKSIIASMAAAVGLMIAGSAVAADMPAEAKELGCVSCHAIDHKVVGPAWMDVSKFYNGKMEKSAKGKTVAEATEGKTPAAWLEHKISEGGKGNWGSAPMIANNKGGANADKKAKIEKLVGFILGLAK